MARDALQTVLRLRQGAVDQARLAFTAAVAADTEARAELRTAEQAIVEEERRASDPDSGDALVEAFARWLPAGRARVEWARAEVEKRSGDLDRSRAELAVARTGLEVVETLLREKRDRLAAIQAGRMQDAIDEAASRCGPGARGSGAEGSGGREQ